jgi:hypothetical protein
LSGEFTVPAKGLTGFQIQMLDTEGMESRQRHLSSGMLCRQGAGRAHHHPDRNEELVTRHATMLVAFEASDDFEIAREQSQLQS